MKKSTSVVKRRNNVEKDIPVAISGPTRLVSDSSFINGTVSNTTSIQLYQPMANNAWVYACVRAISQNIAGVPFKIQEGESDASRPFNPADNTPKGELARVFEQPHPFLTQYQLWESIVALLNLEGMAWIVLDRSNITEIPKQITVHSKTCFEIITNRSTNKIIGFVYTDPGTGEKIPLTIDQVLIFKFFNPYDPFWGLAPLEAARRGILLDLLSTSWQQNFFDNNAAPDGVIISEKRLTRKQCLEILDIWEQRHKGSNNSKRVGILYGGMKWQSTGITQKDMEFMEQRKWTRDEILAVFKVPESELSLYEGLNKASALSQDKSFWQKTLLPIIRNIESVLKARLIPGLRPIVGKELKMFFDLAVVEALQDDFDAKVTNAEKLARIGVPLNEINRRLKLGLPEFEWGDTWYVNRSIVPVDMLREVNAPVKPSGRRVPGINGKPPSGDDEIDPPENIPPSSEDNEEDKGVLSHLKIPPSTVLDEVDNSPKSTPYFIELKKLADDFAKKLETYMYRLRTHQLVKIISCEAIDPVGSSFSKIQWDKKLADRAKEFYEAILDIAIKFNGKNGLSASRVASKNILMLNNILMARVQSVLREGIPDRNELLNRVRKVFNSVSKKSELVPIAHLEIIRVLKLLDKECIDG